MPEQTNELAQPVDDIGGISAQKPVFARPYAIGVFDVLGFKDRFEKMGLIEMMARYRHLIDIVVQRDKHQAEMANFFPFLKEGPYWCSGGEIVLANKVFAAYGSDTFMIWAYYTWTDLYPRNT